MAIFHLLNALLTSKKITKREDAAIAVLLGFYLEGIVDEPIGSRNLDFVHKYVTGKLAGAGGPKRSYAGNYDLGNSSDETFSWDIDAIKFRGRGLFGFTGKAMYKRLTGIDFKTNKEVDTYFSDEQKFIDVHVKFMTEVHSINSGLLRFMGSVGYISTTFLASKLISHGLMKLAERPSATPLKLKSAIDDDIHRAWYKVFKLAALRGAGDVHPAALQVISSLDDYA